MSSRISSACQSYLKASPLEPHPFPPSSLPCSQRLPPAVLEKNHGPSSWFCLFPRPSFSCFFSRPQVFLSLSPVSSSHRHIQSWSRVQPLLKSAFSRTCRAVCHRPRPQQGSPAFDYTLEKATWSHTHSPRGVSPGRNGHPAVYALALGTPGAAASGSGLGASPRRSVQWRQEDMTLVPPAERDHRVNGGTDS